MKISTKNKWIYAVSAVFVFIVISKMDTSDDLSSKQNKASKRPEYTQNQLDSIVEEKRREEIEIRKKRTVSAKKLYAAYEANEVRADQHFKDKTFYVTGNIRDIGKDIFDNIYITLKTNNIMFGVQCYIDEESVVASLRKGMYVTVHGRCEGKLGTVSMKDCKLVKNSKEL